MDWALTGATIGLIIAFCYLLDWLVSKKEEDKQKVTIIKWWSQLDDFNYGEAVRKSNIFCNELLNKIYGKEHFSGQCFSVSVCMTMFSVSILTIICISCGLTKLPGKWFSVWSVLALAYFLNVWIDYISVIERYR